MRWLKEKDWHGSQGAHCVLVQTCSALASPDQYCRNIMVNRLVDGRWPTLGLYGALNMAGWNSMQLRARLLLALLHGAFKGTVGLLSRK